MAQFFFFAGEA